MSRIAILFDNFGPYHLARLRAAAAVTDLLAVEVAARSAEYAWEGRARNAERGEWKIVTLLEAGTSRKVSHRELAARLSRALDNFRPQIVFIPGWSSQAAFAALSWCVRQGVPAVVMSESTEWDERRSAWREVVKRHIVRLYSAALVGGAPHKDYTVQLGMPLERVFLGYDAVENRYFEDKVAEVRSQKSEVRRKFGLPENYFLASARFVEQKNLPRLLKAYSRYRELVKKAENLKSETLKSESGKPCNCKPSTINCALGLGSARRWPDPRNSQLSTLNSQLAQSRANAGFQTISRPASLLRPGKCLYPCQHC